MCFMYDCFIASGGSDKKIIIWNFQKGIQVKMFNGGHNEGVSCICYGKNCLISGGNDKGIVVWDKNGKILNKIKVHGGIVSAIAYVERKNILVSTSWDKYAFA